MTSTLWKILKSPTLFLSVKTDDIIGLQKMGYIVFCSNGIEQGWHITLEGIRFLRTNGDCDELQTMA